MKNIPLPIEEVAALAACMNLPLPLECFAPWAKRSKIFEWHTKEALSLFVVNCHACVYPTDFAEFIRAKFGLRHRTSDAAAVEWGHPAPFAVRYQLPLPLEAFRAWCGKSQLHAWKAEGLAIVNVNGHACLFPEVLGDFLRSKFHLRAALYKKPIRTQFSVVAGNTLTDSESMVSCEMAG